MRKAYGSFCIHALWLQLDKIQDIDIRAEQVIVTGTSYSDGSNVVFCQQYIAD